MDDDLRVIDELFAAALYRAACPPSDQLLLYQTQLLEADAAVSVAAHVQFCAACRSDLAVIAAPPEAGPAERLGAGFAAARTQIRALLTPLAAAPALRGGSARTLSFSAEAYQITLALIPPLTPGALGQIEGQLSGGPPTEGTAELLHADAPISREPIDDLGFFAFDTVAAGTYTLRLTIDETQILIDDLEL